MVGITGKTDDDDVLQAIAVDVMREIAETVAVTDSRDKFPGGSHFMNLPCCPILMSVAVMLWGFVPNVSSNDVGRTVPVKVPCCNTFRPKSLVKANTHPVVVIVCADSRLQSQKNGWYQYAKLFHANVLLIQGISP
jgi:hypothetical protein